MRGGPQRVSGRPAGRGASSEEASENKAESRVSKRILSVWRALLPDWLATEAEGAPVR